METLTAETAAPTNLLDSPAVAKAKAEIKAAKKAKKIGKKIGKKVKAAKKAVKKALKASKKAVKATKKAEKKSRRAFSDADVSKLLAGWKTVREVAKLLKVTTPAAQNYVNALKGVRKVATKEVRQGLRGPLAIAYRVG